MAEGMRAYSGPLPQGKIQVSMYTPDRGRAASGCRDIKSVNLFVKKIMLIKSTKDGERHVRAIHSPSGLEGEGRSDQAAFDALQTELLRHGHDIF